MADRLALIPATAKRAEGVSFEVRLDRGAVSASEMINVDIKVSFIVVALSGDHLLSVW